MITEKSLLISFGAFLFALVVGAEILIGRFAKRNDSPRSEDERFGRETKLKSSAVPRNTVETVLRPTKATRNLELR
jgi:hypothetical protein